ncbi:MAG: transcription elongation factor GreB [Woeseia sp.]|nr:GreA/GreB family elongation factor [Woeseia sp.]NNL54925.1 transcription elongation factor GreB [Woeseia sp.]
MGRWRPPAANSSPYITAKGFDALQAELRELWVRRRDVVKALAAAAAEGDRSENAEYIYRKKELGGIDFRIRYLQKRLPALNVVRELANSDAVYFGATVTVSDADDKNYSYKIVGPDEAKPKKLEISIDSAIAKALLGKRAGDVVAVSVAESERVLSIISICYE